MESEDPISVSLVREIETWSKSILGNPGTEDEIGRWHTRLAATFLNYSFHEDAITEYRLAIGIRPTRWDIRSSLANCLAATKDYAEAVKTLEELIDRNGHLLDTDASFTKSYWDELLHSRGEWNVELKNVTDAEISYVKILEHGMNQEDLENSTQSAIVCMLSILKEQDRFSEALGLLERISDRKNPAGDEWIALLFRGYSHNTTFHNSLTMAAKRGLFDQVLRHYLHVIETTPLQDDNSIQVDRLALQYRLSALLWTLGDPLQQELALNMVSAYQRRAALLKSPLTYCCCHQWEEVIHHDTISEYEDTLSDLRISSARQLAPALLSRSRALAPLESSTTFDGLSYVARLER